MSSVTLWPSRRKISSEGVKQDHAEEEKNGKKDRPFHGSRGGGKWRGVHLRPYSLTLKRTRGRVQTKKSIKSNQKNTCLDCSQQKNGPGIHDQISTGQERLTPRESPAYRAVYERRSRREVTESGGRQGVGPTTLDVREQMTRYPLSPSLKEGLDEKRDGKNTKEVARAVRARAQVNFSFVPAQKNKGRATEN